MKPKHSIFILFALLILSCSPSYYQVFQTKSESGIGISGDNLVYEDENVIVYYNLWSDGGRLGFRIYNKTDVNVFFIKEESFLVINGQAFNYYKNRIFSTSKNSSSTLSNGLGFSNMLTGVNSQNKLQSNQTVNSISSSVSLSIQSGESMVEEKVLTIPPKTYKIIYEYDLVGAIYKDCLLKSYPKGKQEEEITFSKENSPLVFKNNLVFKKEGSDKLFPVNNEFFVSEISNYTSMGMFKYDYPDNCGKKSSVRVQFHNHNSPDRFYKSYRKVFN